MSSQWFRGDADGSPLFYGQVDQRAPNYFGIYFRNPQEICASLQRPSTPISFSHFAASLASKQREIIEGPIAKMAGLEQLEQRQIEARAISVC